MFALSSAAFALLCIAKTMPEKVLRLAVCSLEQRVLSCQLARPLCCGFLNSSLSG